QVGAHHAVARVAVAVLDAVGQLLLLVGGEQRSLVDFAQVGFQRGLDRETSGPAGSCHGATSIERQHGCCKSICRAAKESKKQMPPAARSASAAHRSTDIDPLARRLDGSRESKGF